MSQGDDAERPSQLSGQDEVVDLCRELIRFDTSNPTSNERAAAEWVAAQLADVGLEPTLLESAPGRANVVARWAGADPSLPALLVHGHLDVVPADAADWTVDPFGGEIRDGCLWGRGAVDMKDMDAMTLAVVRDWARQGRRPPRDVVLAFVADEEAGGSFGARWLVDNHPELFEGCTEAISEVGGFSQTIGGRRLYLVEAAEKGMAWLRITARGRAGHGSMVQDDNAVVTLAEAVARVGRHRWPVRLTPAVSEFLHAAADAIGVPFDENDVDGLLAKLGTTARAVGATVRHVTNPSMLEAGYKVNVVPQAAYASIDGRFLPGLEEEFFAELDGCSGRTWTQFVHRDVSSEAPFGTAGCPDARGGAPEDPEAQVVPYCMSGGTDAKSFSRLDPASGSHR